MAWTEIRYKRGRLDKDDFSKTRWRPIIHCTVNRRFLVCTKLYTVYILYTVYSIVVALWKASVWGAVPEMFISLCSKFFICEIMLHLHSTYCTMYMILYYCSKNVDDDLDKVFDNKKNAFKTSFYICVCSFNDSFFLSI